MTQFSTNVPLPEFQADSNTAVATQKDVETGTWKRVGELIYVKECTKPATECQSLRCTDSDHMGWVPWDPEDHMGTL